MLSFPDFFTACSGRWTTERTYHYTLKNEIERSHTEFTVRPLEEAYKQNIISSLGGAQVKAIEPKIPQNKEIPGFAIHFDTVSETGEQVSMSLNALFVPDRYLPSDRWETSPIPVPAAAEVSERDEEVIRGYYLRDQGYSETGAIAGRFTYQPTRQALEMTTFYRRSVAVDRMRFIAPDQRLRTIITYERPPHQNQPPTTVNLVGFGLEQRQAEG
ncbi:phycobiliprotein lyase [Geitlerinema sp. PCC 9228]|uniref:phycobiliprotein lyase n=1 Tax=Geitlerinema sp. PCC 9228 TaxID=111611 RepID=UPI0008F9C659|nr:phycobiliprotein lyase [Geitlerinema sp. PCC 9228]